MTLRRVPTTTSPGSHGVRFTEHHIASSIRATSFSLPRGFDRRSANDSTLEMLGVYDRASTREQTEHWRTLLRYMNYSEPECRIAHPPSSGLSSNPEPPPGADTLNSATGSEGGWSGLIAYDSVDEWPSTFLSAVRANWTVPTAAPPTFALPGQSPPPGWSNLTFVANAWIGIDGNNVNTNTFAGNNATFVQGGTQSYCLPGKLVNGKIAPYTAQYQPFFQWPLTQSVWFGNNFVNQATGRPSNQWGFVINPGDFVDVSIWLAKAPAGPDVAAQFRGGNPPNSGPLSYAANFIYANVTHRAIGRRFM